MRLTLYHCTVVLVIPLEAFLKFHPPPILAPLQRALHNNDQVARKAAMEDLQRATPAAQQHLRDALNPAKPTAPPPMRRAVALLLGYYPCDATLEVLHGAAQDPDAKVRKNVAIALGRCSDVRSLPVVLERLAHEEMHWVRASWILALGTLDHTEARAALQGLKVDSEPEAEAVRKVLGRLEKGAQSASWITEKPWCFPLELTAPIGLEDIALAEAKHAGFCATVHAPGVLRCDPATVPWGSISALRCAHRTQIVLATFAWKRDRPLAEAASFLDPTALRALHGFIDTQGQPLLYRLHIDHTKTTTVRRKDPQRLLRKVRTAALQTSLRDDPSRYCGLLTLHLSGTHARWTFAPTFVPDVRFSYRIRDVGASIQPVIAACLARMVRTEVSGAVFDPTCGSATLLVERALLGSRGTFRGLDCSKTAIEAARTNLKALHKTTSVTLPSFAIERGDAADPRCWKPCAEMLVNLPFGIRTGEDLQDLYYGVVEHLSEALLPRGRALLYTAARRHLTEALADYRKHLRTVETRTVQAGGIEVGVWIVQRRNARV